MKVMQYPGISNQLAKMVASGPKLRYQLDEEGIDEERIWKKIEEVDRQNTSKLKKIVDEIGLPTIDKVGEEGSQNAWVLVQHAGQNELEFMKKYARMMEESMDQIVPRNYAYLIDRIRMMEDKPQIYGTQFIVKDGKTTPYDIGDIENVDKRRAKVGLDSFEEGKKEIGAE